MNSSGLGCVAPFGIALFIGGVIGGLFALASGSHDRAVALIETPEIVEAIRNAERDHSCSSDGHLSNASDKSNCLDLFWRGRADYRLTDTDGGTRIFSIKDSFDDPRLLAELDSKGRGHLQYSTEREIFNFVSYMAGRDLYQKPVPK
ncbi:hypothetical protein G6L37_34955 [Agrobacterium rubi]|nr:hypothetical protein [Agrobacterium rubi]NTF23769.1 hypothetical protein [Agrobacterium rubi]